MLHFNILSTIFNSLKKILLDFNDSTDNFYLHLK